MVARMKLHLEDMGPINEANINIGKITIVGGHNSTGKSTLSKFLYSFLRANSLNREEIAINYLSESVTDLSRYVSFTLSRRDMAERKRWPIIRFKETPNLDILIDKYEKFKSLFFESDVSKDFNDKIIKKFDTIDNLIDITVENQNPLYISLMRSLLTSEFTSSEFNSYVEINNYDENDNFQFSLDFKNHKWEDDEAFASKGAFPLQDVFYVDSIFIFDFSSYYETTAVDHIDNLTKSLIAKPKDVSSSVFDDKVYDEIISLNNEIKEIIGGEIVFKEDKFYYESEDGLFDMINTASGIKQVGIIQKLLANFKLKEECFLIIDEPEVNLHPEWQFKLANILTLISKKLDVSIYINTHSPLFIEAISTFSDYYDISDNTTYHLTQDYNSSKFNVNEIDKNNLSKIYDELGQPYFKMDVLRLEKEME